MENVGVFGRNVPVLVAEGCKCREPCTPDGPLDFWTSIADVCGVVGTRWTTDERRRCGIDVWDRGNARTGMGSLSLGKCNHLGGSEKDFEVFVRLATGWRECQVALRDIRVRFSIPLRTMLKCPRV